MHARMIDLTGFYMWWAFKHVLLMSRVVKYMNLYDEMPGDITGHTQAVNIVGIALI